MLHDADKHVLYELEESHVFFVVVDFNIVALKLNLIFNIQTL